jgi:predicted DNA-binding protein
MSHTLTIRLTPEQAEWLRETAARAGVPRGRIVREQLERAMGEQDRPFMALAGTAEGPADLSERKGFSHA